MSIWKFWGNGSINTTPAGTGVSLTSVAVLCKRIQSGSFTVSAILTPVVFSPAFTSKPVILVSLSSKSGTTGLNQSRWVSDAGASGFNAQTTATGINLEMNWIAIGD
jgi:hypothetical protein